MTSIGWEFWGFSWFLTALTSIVLTVSIWLTAREEGKKYHLDTMAGEEGQEW